MGTFSWHTLCLFALTEYHLNATAYLNIIVDHVCPFMTTAYSFSNGCFQRQCDNKLTTPLGYRLQL